MGVMYARTPAALLSRRTHADSAVGVCAVTDTQWMLGKFSVAVGQLAVRHQRASSSSAAAVAAAGPAAAAAAE